MPLERLEYLRDLEEAAEFLLSDLLGCIDLRGSRFVELAVVLLCNEGLLWNDSRLFWGETSSVYVRG